MRSGPLQVKSIDSILDDGLLESGVIEEIKKTEDPGAWIPPWADAGVLMALAFLSRLLNDDIVRRRLLDAAALYPFKVTNSQDWLSQKWSFELWEKHPRYWTPDFEDSTPLGHYSDLEWLKLYSIPHDYGEAIFHLCSRERLGHMWPPLLHACVLTSLLIRGDPKSGISEYRFAPIFKPRLYDPKEGALDGYHRGMEICLKVPGDAVVRISPDETQRSVLNRQKDPLIREFVRTNWPSVQKRRKEATGYRRRRRLSRPQVARVDCLFRHHVLRESPASIAYEKGWDVGTIEKDVKQLRHLLDLQPKNAVRCLDHTRRPPYLHAAYGGCP